MNSPWNRAGAFAGLLALGALAGCGGAEAPARAASGPPIDPAQAEAELLGRDLADIVDRVMAYRSAHQNRLPSSLRQAGIDSLAPQFVRRLGRQGGEPRVTVVFRRTEGRMLTSCTGTSAVLEDASLRGGAFEVSCTLAAGGTQPFTVPPLPPPPKPE
ncbi:MAG: hypothetical protein IPJ95_03625 [Gemmatimonadetes bacterium]|nr:hypothetical protein [Gemmatimonadota bacterium]MBP6668032.1 hypothetical protein [Gemmatimonadales bacterium]MBK6780441.1 hypothetical protein [Gemmatimonadota bacterium]MBK7351184.1 hypothetical protein [Gemmatimonadota bacterium]MBK7786344.1 hypothetical protein [Gemmatimonadota bacterium]